MNKSEEELDQLHQQIIENLYEIFNEEFDRYFTYYDAAMGILEFGTGHFPFCGRMDDAINPIEKSLKAIETNILDHLTNEIRILWEEKKEKKPLETKYSADLKKKLSKSIRKSIKEIANEKTPANMPT